MLETTDIDHFLFLKAQTINIHWTIGTRLNLIDVRISMLIYQAHVVFKK